MTVDLSSLVSEDFKRLVEREIADANARVAEMLLDSSVVIPDTLDAAEVARQVEKEFTANGHEKAIRPDNGYGRAPKVAAPRPKYRPPISRGECSRCGAPPDEKTPGCITCYNRHYSRSRSRGRTGNHEPAPVIPAQKPQGADRRCLECDNPLDHNTVGCSTCYYRHRARRKKAEARGNQVFYLANACPMCNSAIAHRADWRVWCCTECDVSSALITEQVMEAEMEFRRRLKLTRSV